MRMWKWVHLILLAALFAMSMFQHDVSANSDNWETLESRLLAETSEIAWRKENVLHLKLLDGSTIQLADVPYNSKGKNADYAIHRLVGYIKTHEYFVIGISHRTGLNGALIDRKTGQRTELDGVAVFSPDNTRFFTIDFFTTDFIRHPNSKNRMQVWKITPSGLVLEWEFQPRKSWSSVEAKWIGNASIEVVRLEYRTYKDGEGGPVPRQSNFLLSSKGWVVMDLPTLETH